MRYEFDYQAKFLRDVKRLKRKHYDMSLLLQVIDDLAVYDAEQLARRWHDHQLTGRWAGFRELHVSADWLLIYRREGRRMVLVMMTMGSHDGLFRNH